MFDIVKYIIYFILFCFTIFGGLIIKGDLQSHLASLSSKDLTCGVLLLVISFFIILNINVENEHEKKWLLK